MFIFIEDSIYYMKGFGFSDVEKKEVYTKQTVQIIASISRTLIEWWSVQHRRKWKLFILYLYGCAPSLFHFKN